MTDDEVDAEIAFLLEDPELRADLEQAEREIESGTYVNIPHEEAMRVLGLDKPKVDGLSETSL